MKTFLLFVGKNCPACATMKANMAKTGMRYEEISTDIPYGALQAITYRVQSIPMLVVLNDGKPDTTYPGALPVSELEKIKGR